MSTNLSDMFERLGEEQDQLCARVAEKVSVYSECLNNLDKKKTRGSEGENGSFLWRRLMLG